MREKRGGKEDERRDEQETGAGNGGCHLLMASLFLQINSHRAVTFSPSPANAGSISPTLYFPCLSLSICQDPPAAPALKQASATPLAGDRLCRRHREWGHDVIEGRWQGNSIKSIRHPRRQSRR